MTTKERTALQGFINRFTEIAEEKDDCFHELIRLNPRPYTWGCAIMNYKDILNSYPEGSPEEIRGNALYERYCELCGAEENLRKLTDVLGDIDFWKK